MESIAVAVRNVIALLVAAIAVGAWLEAVSLAMSIGAELAILILLPLSIVGSTAGIGAFVSVLLRDVVAPPRGLFAAAWHGIRRWPGVFGVTVLLGLIIIAACLPVGIVGMGLMMETGPELMLLMAAVFLVGGGLVYAAVHGRWMLALPMVVVEPMSTSQAMSRAPAISKGYGLALFICGVAMFAVPQGTGMLLPLLALPAWLTVVVLALVTPLPLVIMVAAYRHCRAPGPTGVNC